MSLSIKIKLAREAQGLTQRELAEKTGITPGHIGMIESGKTTPSLKTINKISEALNIDPSQFIEKTSVDKFLEYLSPKEKEYVEKHKPVIAYLAEHELTIEDIRNAVDVWMTIKQNLEKK